MLLERRVGHAEALAAMARHGPPDSSPDQRSTHCQSGGARVPTADALVICSPFRFHPGFSLVPLSAVDDVFAKEATLMPLPGGSPLVKAGETVAGLYRLVAGRLGEVEPMVQGGGRLVTIHRPVALIGGAQLLGDGFHRTTVTALRDSELQAIPADRAQTLLRDRPDFLAEVARTALERMRTPESSERRKSSVLGLVAASASIDMRDLAERVAAGMRALGAEVVVLGAEAQDSAPSYLHALEVEHDFILMAAQHREANFIEYCNRQIDRLIVAGDPALGPPGGLISFTAAAIRTQRLIDVVLVHPADARRPVGSDRWLDAAPISRLFHIRLGDEADVARLARIYTGNSIGLALSGGGAKAYAHVGVLRALTELGVPVDFFAGTSMGAVIAAGAAMGWGDAEMDRRLHEAFVDSSPLSDVAFPFLALTRGRIVDQRLKAHFDDVQISDLWRPFTCVSTDLTIAGMHIHQRGPLHRALRASLSLPGVLPPVIEMGHVLVDGALLRNLPADLVSQQHEGVTIAVDVAAAEGLKPTDLLLEPSGWRWFTSGAWHRGPPIVAILIRSVTVPSLVAASISREELIEITPKIEGVGLQDWKAYDKAAAAGYRAAMAAADALSALCR
jgi:NTE family protein